MRTDQLFLVLSTLASLAIATPKRRNETLPTITSTAIPAGAIESPSDPNAPKRQSQVTVMTDAAGNPTFVTLYASTAPTLSSAPDVASTPTLVPVAPVTTLVSVATSTPTVEAAAPPPPPPPSSPPPPPPPASTKSGKAPKPSKSSKDSKVAKNRYSSSKAMQYARALVVARSVPEEGDVVPEKRVVTEEVGLRRVGVDFEERDDTTIPDTGVAVPATEVISGSPPKDLPLAPGATVITVDASPAAPTKKTQKDKSGIAASIWNSSKVGRFKRGEEGDGAVREETGVIADEVDLHGDDVDVVRRGEGAKAGFIGVEG